MLTRCAIFEGRIAEGREDEFFELIEQRLLPLWRQMPNATAVRLNRPVQHDPDAPPIVMIQEVDYPSAAALEEALASDVRTRSRAVTLEILQLFDGRFYHVVCERLAPA